MVKYLGIDYGAKKIGISLSDSGGSIAFPHDVIQNDERTIAVIVGVLAKEGVGGIVAGDTRAQSGGENNITATFQKFIEGLEQASKMKVVLVSELGTTGAARAPHGEGEARGEVSSRRAQKDTGVDARAAAIILQRFLDAHRHVVE